MDRIKSITFDKEAQDNLPHHIKDKMKADRDNARKKTKSKGLNIPIVTKRFICDSCEEEWEEEFKCDKCSGLHYVPEYDENGFDEDGANWLLSTCFNCCNCHSK